ncbi:WecB/TagA/CpsF family glycosyltransferase [Lentilactobacillus laojiaonis]|uniref:WecB/TagA/CpsF family glycosyltransferase n=1 Tax=Lentilactobacillus laojiaonis TaxID=2883998 RepID=UPI001D0A58FC|nr:WecB/TagA/CpsF family glycosyltransferase [Lentilactobacillus laojiaonis]UDM31903.1 WecB/TagA/CpsF family glycosyltransferase [Lentilactobacillus laojiaonis]
MTTNSVKILDINFINTTFNQFTNQLHKRIDQHQKTFVVTANPEIVMYAKQHPSYKKIIQTADFITADGTGIVMGSKIIKDPLPERITGFDLFINLLTWGNQHHKSVYLLGSKPEVIKKVVQKVQQNYPNLKIIGFNDGYFKDDTPIIEKIKAGQPDMVFVATGFPKQEEFIYHNQHLANGLWMGIGGSFDVLAGNVKRAPQIWQKMHLEWLYRVIKEPSRITRLSVLPKYLKLVIKQKR